jgi:hypothetical protein
VEIGLLDWTLLVYELRGKLQIQLLCGADDNPRGRMNTGRYEKRDPDLTLRFSIPTRHEYTNDLWFRMRV